MKLHADILTDLVILYHAGEASQASRALLEEEALHDPQIAAALTATARNIPQLPVSPALHERKVLRKVRTRYQVMAFGLVWTLALLAIALFPHLAPPGAAVGMAITLVPFAILVLFFGAAVGAFYLFFRGGR